MTMAASAGWGMFRNKGVKKINVKKQKTAPTRLASWLRAPAAVATDVFDRSDQLLVWIDCAAALHCCCFGCAECLGVTDQHDSQRARHEFLQCGELQIR